MGKFKNCMFNSLMSDCESVKTMTYGNNWTGLKNGSNKIKNKCELLEAQSSDGNMVQQLRETVTLVMDTVRNCEISKKR